MKKSIIPLLILLNFGCTEKSEREKPQKIHVENSHEKIDKKTNIRLSNISQLFNDSCSLHFYGGGIFSLCFKQNTVKYFFNAQCLYQYTSELKEDTIYFKWNNEPNCTFDRGLKNTFNLKSFPIEGKPFAYFVLLNDTTLRAKYFYEEWVLKINSATKDIDTLFPRNFYLKQR